MTPPRFGPQLEAFPEISGGGSRDMRPEHPKGCWMLDGHHACAIDRIRQLQGDPVRRAYFRRGKMIRSLSEKCAQLELRVKQLAKLARRSA